MKQIFRIPYTSIYIDLRKWYYVYISGELMPWWVVEGEKEELAENDKDIKFKKVPLLKSLI